MASNTNGAETFGKFILGLIGLTIASFLYALALKQGWLWFVVPFGLNPIGYFHALGLASLIGLLTKDGYEQGEEKSFAERTARGILKPLIVLFFMWIYHSLM